MPCLAALGMAVVGEAGLYTTCLAAVTARNLNATSATKAFVFELSRRVAIKAKFSKEVVPPDMLTVEQFVHILAFMADRRGVEVATPQLKRNLWNKTMLDKLGAEVEQTKVWPMLRKIPGFTLPEVEEVEVLREVEAEKEMVPEVVEVERVEEMETGEEVEEAVEMDCEEEMETIEEVEEAVKVDCMGYMAAAGVVGEAAEEVVRQLGEMEATMVTNGLVVEVIGRFGYPVQAALTSALARQLGIQEQYVTCTLGDRFRCV